MGTLNASLLRIKGKRVYVDANIFIYFLDRSEQYFDVVAQFFQCFDAGQSFAYTGDAAVAETLYKPYQVDDVMRVSEFKAFFANDEFLTVLPHTTKVFELAGELAPKRGMKLIDALHYATAALAGCSIILTNDAGFKSNTGVEIIYLKDLLKP